MKESYIPFTIKLSLGILIALIVFRLQTLWFNSELFDFMDIDPILALRFDLSMLGYLSLPLALVLFFARINPYQKFNFLGLKVLSWILFLLILLPEMWDLIYINYAAKRSSFEVYSFFISGKDRGQLSTLIIRFWYLIPLFIFWLTLFYFFLKIIGTNKSQPITHKRFILHWICYTSVAFVLARNSFGPKPLGIADAVNPSNPLAAQITLNAPFVVLKTIQNKALSTQQFISIEEEKKVFNPIQVFKGHNREIKPNLIFIVVESLGNKQLFRKKNGRALTPFLDSLVSIQSNTLCTAGLAEGKTSIECLPAIFAGIPSLLETPFTLSNYSTNSLNGFPSICRNKGYKTLFFHGASRGSMRFDATAHSLGFEQTYFKEEIDAIKINEGSWGFHDHAVLHDIEKKLNRTKTPFLMTFFTLSTHEPYDIPKKESMDLTKAEKAYAYLDKSLANFFRSNAEKKWFKNSIIVITGDHTPVHLDNAKYQIEDYYSVPIIMIQPKGMNKLVSIKNHLDIVPSLCNILNWNTTLYSYGNKPTNDAIRYLNGIYYIWNDDYELRFHETNQKWDVILKKVKKTEKNHEKLVFLKIAHSKKQFLASLQRLRRDLFRNKLHK